MKEAIVPRSRSLSAGWLSPIPSSWPVVRLKYLARLFAGGTPNRGNREYWDDGTIPWLNSGEVNQWVITTPSEYITEEGLRNSSAKWIPKGALVMALAGQGKTKGMVAELAINSTSNQSMAAIVPNEPRIARFLLYWLNANYETIRSRAGGEQRDGLNLEIIGDIPCPNPALKVQCAIANYLDKETLQIDALISAKERLLELLADKRQALITTTVTRGLNPHVTLRDSEVFWLGRIPQHWRIAGFTKYLVGFVDYRGRTPEKTRSGAFLLTARNIKNGYIDYENSEEFVDPADLDEIMRRGIPSLGQILFTTEAPLGQAALVDRVDIAIAQRVIKLDYDPTVLLNTYALQWILSAPFQYQLGTLATGSTALGIKGERLHLLRNLIPPLDEQHAIIEYLTRETAKIEDLKATTERSIDLLRERRAAMIAATVTGKIDVEAAT